MQTSTISPLSRLLATLSRLVPAQGLLAAVLVLSGLLAGGLAPEPDPIPRKWQLEVEVGPLRYATVDPGDGSSRSYYYMTYKVTNNSGGDLLFAPAFDLANDNGDLLRSGRDVPASVTRELLNRLGNPYLEDQIGIVGLLLQGEGNAKEGLVVWPAVSLHGAELSLYAAGFSGETKAVDITDPATGKPARAMLRKTLMVRYHLPGSLTGLGNRPVEEVEKRWVMR
jgi:hypothetical protein